MQKIFVARGNQQLGQFWPQEVADGLKSGRFLPTDLAWKEGMGTWVALSGFPDLPVASPGLEASRDAVLSGPGENLNLPGAAPEGVGVAQPAWERREELGFIPAAIATIKQVLFTPGETFAALPPTGGIFGPIVFSVIFGWIGVLFVLAYQAMVFAINPEALSGGEATTEEAVGVATFIGLAIFAPVLIILGLFVGGAILHVLLLLLGGAKQPFTTTLRVLAYVQGATGLLQVIPLCGGFVASVWYFISATIGLSKAHNTEVWRVVVAMILPLVLLCGLAIMVAVFIGAATAAGGPGLK